jgi:hypothetical protein
MHSKKQYGKNQLHIFTLSKTNNVLSILFLALPTADIRRLFNTKIDTTLQNKTDTLIAK